MCRSAQSALCSARRAQVLVAKVKCKTSARPLADTRSAHARTAAERGGETLIQQQRLAGAGAGAGPQLVC